MKKWLHESMHQKTDYPPCKRSYLKSKLFGFWLKPMLLWLHCIRLAQESQSNHLRAERRTNSKPKTPMVRQRGRKDSQTPSTKSMPNNSNLDYKRKLTTISLSPRIDRKFNTKSRSPSYDKMEIISIGTEEIEKDEIRKISTSSKPSLSPVNEGMFFFSLCIWIYSNWILDFSTSSNSCSNTDFKC